MDNHDPSLDAARRRVAAAYDPELLRSAGHRLADLLAEHLRSVQASESVVLNWCDPRELSAEAAALCPSFSQGTIVGDAVDASLPGLTRRFAELVQLSLSHGINLHDPRYVGHQVPAPVPIAGLFDAIGSVTNQPMAIYEMGPWGTAVEQAMIGRLAECIGWQGTNYGGIVTHGASLANLTALLVARNVTLGESWERGVAGATATVASDKPAKLVVQADAHYCIARSAGILGLGTDHVVKAPLDERRRMDPVRLDETLRELKQAGHPIVAVVACACATPIGAFDPLDEIADVCARHGVWLHVDAAHGGAALLSRRHRHLVAGLERADSLTWDAHKMLFVPALCAFLFYKDKRHSYEAFRQNAPYLFDPSMPGLAEFDSGLRTVECTKRAAALALWGVWSLFGPQLFADLVDVTFDLGRKLYARLVDAPDFVALHEPQCNIVMFRHVPAALQDAPPERIGEFQWLLRKAVVQSGQYYLVPAAWNGVATLRCTLINPLTTEADLDGLLTALREAGKVILQRF
ncbi:MAG: aminotransferase class I/II-fold pyridoxal phosphate-dependent enzyme [Planctomycetaceae bacterium]|nr:aminotransferase class I/II-fold pyridoxal phosphate-dependent enzyme [Planctomycetaceae bacterium]